MGETNATPPELGGSECCPQGDYDEKPAHKVTISRPFHMSRTQVTVEQFRRFRPDYPAEGRYVINVSWYEAMAFCDWLSQQGRQALPPADRGRVGVRLPRGHGRAYFHSGDRPPQGR